VERWKSYFAATTLIFGSFQLSSSALASTPGPVKLPLIFEENRGQAGPDVRFLARGEGYTIAVGPSGNRLVLGRAALGFRFAGSNSAAPELGQAPLSGRINYLRGKQQAWLTDIPTFERIRQTGVYPGIDVVYYGNQSRLEYDIVVSPGASIRKIAIAFDDAARLSIDDEGNLHVKSGAAELIQKKPVIYQSVGGSARRISGRYKLLRTNVVGFEVGRYDRSKPLIIDPILTYSTYLGGSNGDENARGIVTDAAGYIYVTGSTTSTNFPVTSGAFQTNAGTVDPSLGYSDAFVTKINPAGTALVYSTYIGGSGDDDAAGIALDANGNVIITGTTSSTDFPVTSGAFQSACNVGQARICVDAFVAKLNPAGSALVFATYLGGTGDEEARGVALDGTGNIYVAGKTASTDFPIAGTPYSTAASQGGFVAKLSPVGALLASTYFGTGSNFGTGVTEIRGIAVDAAGNAYLTGATPSSPTTATDVFIAKLNSSLTALVYSNFLRGSNDESGDGIALDSAGNVYVTGWTSSRNFTVTSNALQKTLAGGPAFKSIDGGLTWNAVATAIARTSLQALAVSPSAPSTLYAGADDDISGGLYKSVDGGTTWTEADSGMSVDSRVHAIVVDPQHPSIVYAGTRSGGVYKSMDGAATWTATGLNSAFATALAVDPLTSSTVYAGVDGGGVFKSTDAGMTWTAVNNGLTSLDVRALAIHPAITSTIFVGTTAGMFKSMDAGASWIFSGAGLFDPNVNAIVIDPRNPNTLLAGTSSIGIFRSTNGGAGWFMSNSGITSSSSGILVSALGIDASNGTYYAAAGELNAVSIYTSTNGITWSPTSLASTRVTAIAIDPSGVNGVFAATLGGADAFVARWDTSGMLVYSTLLGGDRDDVGNGIAVDVSGNVYIAGTTSSANFPVVNAIQPVFGGGTDVVTDAFVTKLNLTAASVPYSTYLGGTSNDFGNAVAVDSNGSAYVAGQTGSSDFPIAQPLGARSGLLDAFIAKITDTNVVTYSVAARGGFSTSSHGVGGAVTAGYGRLSANSGSTTPQGMAIFSFRPNNILVSEAAVPASSPLTSGRLYVEVGGAVNTGIAIANPNTVAATVTFTVTSNNGSSTQGTIIVNPNSQVAAFLNQPPFSVASASGAMTFSASSPVAVVALRGLTNERGEFLITTLPVVDLSTAATGVVLFPDYADGGGWTTQVILVNPTDIPLSGNIQFYSQSGQPGTPSTYSIPARGSFKLQTGGTPAAVQGGSVRVTPTGANDPSPAGIAIFSYRPSGVTVSETGVLAVRPGSAFRMYAEASGFFNTTSVGSQQSGMAIVNAGATQAVVNFELNTLNGASTGLTGTVTIPGNGQTAMFLGQIPGFAILPIPLQGVLRISTPSTPGISVVGLRGRYNERQDFLITTTQPIDESTPGSSADFFFPHFADGGGYTTQFVVFNGLTDRFSSGTIRFFTQAGQALSLALR